MDYTPLQTLNDGSYGTVQLVKQAKSDKLFALKRVSLELSSLEDVQNEIDVQLRVHNHPRIVYLENYFHVPEKNEFVLVLEYCQTGDLHDRIANRKQVSFQEIRRIMLQLLDAVEHCHINSVYHRDIKPENVFLTSNGTVKLGDFGLATFSRLCSDFGTGSDQYMAPECFDRRMEAYDAAKADIWAVGVVLLNYMFKRTPFKQATDRDPLFQDFARSRECLYDIFPQLTPEVFNVLRHSLTINPDHRSIPKMREAIKNVKNWTTDMEQAEMLEKRAPVLQVPRHTPFRQPSAVAQPLKSPTTNWDRRKMFTPPTSRASFLQQRRPPVLPVTREVPEEVFEMDMDL